jgi:hypothetical protein
MRIFGVAPHAPVFACCENGAPSASQCGQHCLPRRYLRPYASDASKYAFMPSIGRFHGRWFTQDMK